MDKELDLKKFLNRMRLFQIATLGLLTAKQQVFAQKMSHIVVHEDHTDTTEQANDSE